MRTLKQEVGPIHGSQAFSEVTKAYLCRFYSILDEMIAKMTKAQPTDSLSHTFIVQMIPHHQAAIDMSCNILPYATFLPLQTIARNIITEQTQSIEKMQQILDRCGAFVNSEQDVCLYLNRFHTITERMFSQMQKACADNDINADFMREMIPHHEGAIRMARNALCYPLCPELFPILQAIIVSQEKGVCEMKRLLRCM